MKTLNVTLEDEEYERLMKVKGSRTWRGFILQLAESKAKKEGSLGIEELSLERR